MGETGPAGTLIIVTYTTRAQAIAAVTSPREGNRAASQTRGQECGHEGEAAACMLHLKEQQPRTDRQMDSQIDPENRPFLSSFLRVLHVQCLESLISKLGIG